MSFCFAIVSELQGDSSVLAQSVASTWLATCAAAIQAQLRDDVAAHYPGAADATVRVSDGRDIAPGEVVVGIKPTLPEAPEDVAYHDVGGNAAPYIVVALETCHDLHELSGAISHECVETVRDPDCNDWIDMGTGQELAAEPCDPVQGNGYFKGDIYVSDFVLPSFWDAGGQAPYSFVDKMNSTSSVLGPFQSAAGGYEVVRPVGGPETQVRAARLKTHPSGIAARRMKKLRHWSSRASRLGVKP